MTSRRTKGVIAAAIAFLAAGGYLVYSVYAAQAHPDKALAQAPMNTQVQVPAAFIMAVDDSGSMTYHNQFPGADGRGCWSGPSTGNNWSFFSSKGVLRTGLSGGRGSCTYYYSYTGPRSGNNFYGIPPVDDYGFARSSDYNPAYFDPEVRYEPWVHADGTPYPQASLPDTRIDPRESATIRLASWVEDENSRSRFQAYTNMELPRGTHYRTVGNSGCGGLEGGGWKEVTKGGGHKMTANCAIYVRYWPATFYTSWNSGSDPWPKMAGRTDVYTSSTAPREKIENACGNGCHLWRYRIQPGTEAHQNFANWFSYYGNRNRAMIAAMTRSLANVNNMRVGYFSINSGLNEGRSSGSEESHYQNYSDVKMYDMGDSSQRPELYAEMLGLQARGNTPNLPAVKHMGEQFKRTDANAPVKYSCQRNGGMLFTDGRSNVATTASGISGLGAPFDTTHDNTLAAIASQYYFNTNGTVGSGGESPLGNFASGQVPIPAACSGPDSVERRRLNCQSNQHMNFYGVTLGARGQIFDPDVEQDPFVLNPAWPGYNSGSVSTIDDIWHATVNTRGEFINARTPIDIVYAMRRILASVSSGASPYVY